MVERPLEEWLIRGYEVVRLDLDEGAAAALKRGAGAVSRFEIVARPRYLDEGLRHMRVLTIPATRHLLL